MDAMTSQRSALRCRLYFGGLLRRVAMIAKTAGRILGGLCAIMLACFVANVAQAEEKGAIPPERVAEYIHAVIQTDRSIYSTHVVEQLQGRKVTVAEEDWKERGALPLPAQMLQMAGQE